MKEHVGIRKNRLIAKTAMGGVLAAVWALGQAPVSLPPSDELKKMSLEELMDIEVTLVSRRPEKLNEASSSIQVITRNDIRRAGVTTLPQALRLASNLQVAQVDTRQWAISARGFNGTTANKLLVMIDGRTIYTPLYSGVFWDAQHVLLEDVDRIEVISGPGGTLWGANAVNGVINIVTQGAENTQGVFAVDRVGTLLEDFGAVRYGGKIGSNLFFRAYGQRFDHRSGVLPDGSDGRNAWDLLQGGFRADWRPEGMDKVMVQGDLYGGSAEQRAPGRVPVDGQYMLGRWTRSFSAESDIQAQVYADRTHRKIPNVFAEDLHTYDFDFQHRFPLGKRQGVLWGAGYRLMQDEVENGPALAFLPGHKVMQLFSGFVQDQFTVIEERLTLTLGSKFEHNDYSGFEFQPAARAAWTPNEFQTAWGAVSRGVRSPSRIDVELYAPFPTLGPGGRLAGGPDFTSEKLIAYELGYRVQPREWLSLSAAAFYNRYDDIRMVEQTDSITLELTNGFQGDARGLELSGRLQAARWWRMRGGYTYLETDFREKSGHAAYGAAAGEGNDPAHQFSFQSMMDLPAGFQFNSTGRFAGELPNPNVPDYFTYDAGIVWEYRNFELSIMGHNLAVKRHPEFGAAATRQEIPRSFSGRAAWRL